VLILDPVDTYRYLEVRGAATVEDDGEYLFTDRVGRKYGADLRTLDKPTDRRAISTIRPLRVNAVDVG
jgi:hypothetical protein